MQQFIIIVLVMINIISHLILNLILLLLVDIIHAFIFLLLLYLLHYVDIWFGPLRYLWVIAIFPGNILRIPDVELLRCWFIYSFTIRSTALSCNCLWSLVISSWFTLWWNFILLLLLIKLIFGWIYFLYYFLATISNDFSLDFRPATYISPFALCSLPRKLYNININILLFNKWVKIIIKSGVHTHIYFIIFSI